jgi:hypothetical protein
MYLFVCVCVCMYSRISVWKQDLRRAMMRFPICMYVCMYAFMRVFMGRRGLAEAWDVIPWYIVFMHVYTQGRSLGCVSYGILYSTNTTVFFCQHYACVFLCSFASIMLVRAARRQVTGLRDAITVMACLYVCVL